MMIRTPHFWYEAAGWQSTLLSPLATLYGLGRRLAASQSNPEKASIPVICIGNLTAGGSGKTPTALAVMEIIKASGLAKNPHFLTRGYGGRHKGSVLVNPDLHTAKDVGDETLLLAAKAPTIVSANRAHGAALAANIGADMIIMDDGFQNSTLHKDVSLIVIDGAAGFGNQYLIPAGPLRENLQDGFARADAFLIIGEDRHDVESLLPGKPVFKATIKASAKHLDKGQRYLAFAGLGRPEKFRNTLEEIGVSLAAWQSFADHHPYKQEDIDTLHANAAALNAELLTTEKDKMRLQYLDGADDIQTLPITLNIKKKKALETLLKNVS